jgi:tetrahydromethanopterin S-methyltransferase subunit C
MAAIPYYTLNDGSEIPSIGMGYLSSFLQAIILTLNLSAFTVVGWVPNFLSFSSIVSNASVKVVLEVENACMICVSPP